MLKIYESIRHDFASLDRIAVIALLYVAFALACNYYLNNPKTVCDLLQGTPFSGFGDMICNTERNNLPQLSFWALVISIFYFIIPVFLIKVVFGANVSDFGLKFDVEDGFWGVLLISLAIMIPLVFLASLTEGFSAKYPFFKVFDGSSYLSGQFVIWQLLYFAQFFCVEFFFRGFMIQSLRPSIGFYSIFVMTIPYCMIHFGKPPAETFAAIAAGVFLGWLSYSSGSILLGLALHCSVAFLMDILALYQKKLLF